MADQVFISGTDLAKATEFSQKNADLANTLRERFPSHILFLCAIPVEEKNDCYSALFVPTGYDVDRAADEIVAELASNAEQLDASLRHAQMKPEGSA